MGSRRTGKCRRRVCAGPSRARLGRGGLVLGCSCSSSGSGSSSSSGRSRGSLAAGRLVVRARVKRALVRLDLLGVHDNLLRQARRQPTTRKAFVLEPGSGAIAWGERRGAHLGRDVDGLHCRLGEDRSLCCCKLRHRERRAGPSGHPKTPPAILLRETRGACCERSPPTPTSLCSTALRLRGQSPACSAPPMRWSWTALSTWASPGRHRCHRSGSPPDRPHPRDPTRCRSSPRPLQSLFAEQPTETRTDPVIKRCQGNGNRAQQQNSRTREERLARETERTNEI